VVFEKYHELSPNTRMTFNISWLDIENCLVFELHMTIKWKLPDLSKYLALLTYATSQQTVSNSCLLPLDEMRLGNALR